MSRWLPKILAFPMQPPGLLTWNLKKIQKWLEVKEQNALYQGAWAVPLCDAWTSVGPNCFSVVHICFIAWQNMLQPTPIRRIPEQCSFYLGQLIRNKLIVNEVYFGLYSWTTQWVVTEKWKEMLHSSYIRCYQFKKGKLDDISKSESKLILWESFWLLCCLLLFLVHIADWIKDKRIL